MPSEIVDSVSTIMTKKPWVLKQHPECLKDKQSLDLLWQKYNELLIRVKALEDAKKKCHQCQNPLETCACPPHPGCALCQ